MTEISATTQIAAPPRRVWAILVDLDSYPDWNPLFRAASGHSFEALNEAIRQRAEDNEQAESS